MSLRLLWTHTHTYFPNLNNFCRPVRQARRCVIRHPVGKLIFFPLDVHFSVILLAAQRKLPLQGFSISSCHFPVHVLYMHTSKFFLCFTHVVVSHWGKNDFSFLYSYHFCVSRLVYVTLLSRGHLILYVTTTMPAIRVACQSKHISGPNLYVVTPLLHAAPAQHVSDTGSLW